MSRAALAVIVAVASLLSGCEPCHFSVSLRRRSTTTVTPAEPRLGERIAFDVIALFKMDAARSSGTAVAVFPSGQTAVPTTFERVWIDETTHTLQAEVTVPASAGPGPYALHTQVTDLDRCEHNTAQFDLELR